VPAIPRNRQLAAVGLLFAVAAGVIVLRVTRGPTVDHPHQRHQLR